MSADNEKLPLDLDQDLRHEARQWKAERIGWVIMLLLAIASLIGLLGHGPLSRTHVQTPDGSLRVEYFRFERAAAKTDLKLTANTSVAEDGLVAIWLDRTYLESLDVDEITPEPERTEAFSDRFVYHFRAPDNQGQISIRIRHEITSMGVANGVAGVPGHGEVRFKQLVYP